jgi:hypothetical protein
LSSCAGATTSSLGVWIWIWSTEHRRVSEIGTETLNVGIPRWDWTSSRI